MKNTAKQENSKKLSTKKWLDMTVATFLITLLAPVFAFNSLIAILKQKKTLVKIRKVDALGRTVVINHFNFGVFRKTAVLLNIISGHLGFVGISLNHLLGKDEQKAILAEYDTVPGLISLYDVHDSVGLELQSPVELLIKQLSLGTFDYLILLTKGLIGLSLYKDDTLQEPKIANMFNLPINNVVMSQAVDWAVNGTPLSNRITTSETPQLGFFINAHSINVAETNPLFKSCLRHANALFADGSGMRVAAKSIGINLQGNINGTDMLPVLCKAAEANGKSIFLLGGKSGRAEKAAQALQASCPNLKIAGTRHGFFDFENKADNAQIIEQINASNADIVLVGLGSPNQEQWCQHNIDKLQCTSVLAVGGLFDYFSGAIPRAPLLFRELGLEWVWRLLQEPKVKFKRYVIGTPTFLVRTFLLKQV